MNKYITYLNERFPLQSHIPIIAVFSFSAVCYSLSCADALCFVEPSSYFAAFYLTISTFFLLRISDEFKDHEEDMLYRKYLPVPRGLVTLRSLRNIGIIVLSSQVLLLILFPKLVWIYLLAIGYMALMYKEFLVGSWLKKHQIAYVFCHMAIIPIVDLVASAAHWAQEGIDPPKALAWFFLVSFFNGMVLEFGRKIRIPETEEEGVVSYTKLYGYKGGIILWFAILSITLICAGIAANAIHSPWWVYSLLGIFYLVAAIPGLQFYINPTKQLSKKIEIYSGLWTLGMYLNIGALPFTINHLI